MAMGVILLIAQASAAPAAAGAGLPDIELAARIEAREVRIEREGPIALKLEVEPGVSKVDVRRNQPAGARTYRNLVINARVAAWLGQGAQSNAEISAEEPTGEQPR